MHFLNRFRVFFFQLCISLFAFPPTSPDCQRHVLNETRESDPLRASVDSGGLDDHIIEIRYYINGFIIDHSFIMSHCIMWR